MEIGITLGSPMAESTLEITDRGFGQRPRERQRPFDALNFFVLTQGRRPYKCGGACVRGYPCGPLR